MTSGVTSARVALLGELASTCGKDLPATGDFDLTLSQQHFAVAALVVVDVAVIVTEEGLVVDSNILFSWRHEQLVQLEAHLLPIEFE